MPIIMLFLFYLLYIHILNISYSLLLLFLTFSTLVEKCNRMEKRWIKNVEKGFLKAKGVQQRGEMMETKNEIMESRKEIFRKGNALKVERRRALRMFQRGR